VVSTNVTGDSFFFSPAFCFHFMDPGRWCLEVATTPPQGLSNQTFFPPRFYQRWAACKVTPKNAFSPRYKGLRPFFFFSAPPLYESFPLFNVNNLDKAGDKNRRVKFFFFRKLRGVPLLGFLLFTGVAGMS